MTEAMPTAVLEKLVARIPAGRMGLRSGIAAVVGFLASPSAAHVTGQVIYACGESSLAPMTRSQRVPTWGTSPRAFG